MRRSRHLQLRWLIIGLFVAIVLIGMILSNHLFIHIDRAIVEYYSPDYYISSSIADARQRQVFVAQLRPKNYIIQGLGREYTIQQIWIEKKVRIKYLGWYPNTSWQIVPLGSYRLMVRLSQPMSNEDIIFCNNSIRLEGWQSEVVRFAEIPSSMQSINSCKFIK